MRRSLALGAIAGPILFTASWLVLGFISTGYTMWDIVVPSYSPIAQPISGLGLGATGPFMNAAFIVSGILLFAGVLGIVREMRDLSTRSRIIAGVLLSLAPLGMAVDGIFTLESFMPHFIGFIVAVVGTVVGFFITSRLVADSQRWRAMSRPLALAGALTLALVIINQLAFDPLAAGSNIGIAGLTERVLVVEMLAWFVVLGVFALRKPPAIARRHTAIAA